MKYDIGTWVIVHSKRIKKRYYNTGEVSWIEQPLIKSRIGRVVGLAKRYSGTRKVIHGSCSWDGEWEPDERYLDISKKHTFYKVILGWFNIALLVSEEDIEILNPKYAPQDLPKLFTEKPEYDGRYKEYLREEMKNWPRDQKGRWTKL